MYKDLHTHVDGIPNLSRFKFNDYLNCPTCLRANLGKNPSSHESLRSRLKLPYQGMYIDFGFSGKVQTDKNGKVIESTRAEVEGLNGATCWLLISDGKTRMLYGDC